MKKHTRSISNNNKGTITVHVMSPGEGIIHKSLDPYSSKVSHLRLALSINKKRHLNTIQLTTDDEKEPLPNSENLIHNKLYYLHYIHTDSPHTKTYSKHMSDIEYAITMEMNNKGVTPKVLQAFPLKNNSNNNNSNNNSNKLKWTIIMESWPMTWLAYKKTDKYHSTRDILLPRLLEKIETTHHSGIYHGDLTTHMANVMVDLDKLDVAIIDWGQSMYIDKMKETNVEMIVESEDLNSENIKTPDDLVQYEYNYVKENY